MMEHAGLTINGASTYYANFKSGSWRIDGHVPAATTSSAPQEIHGPFPVFELMTTDALLEYFNSRSEFQLKRFRDHDTAVKRVLELTQPPPTSS